MDFVKPPKTELPIAGSALFGYLFKVNQYETEVANNYLQADMAEVLKTKVNSWFKAPPPEFNNTLFRLIANSVLAAGEAGLTRTTEALSKLHFQKVPLIKQITPGEAALELRKTLQDYRAAKNWLDNKSKCVRSIVMISVVHGQVPEGLEELCNLKITDYQDWQKWQGQTFEYWNSKTSIAQKLRGSYKHHWNEFQGSFDAVLKNSQYQQMLQNKIWSTIHDNEMWDLVDKAEADMANSMVEYKEIINKYELQVNISGSEIFFYVTLNDRLGGRAKLNAIKTGIVYELSDLLKKTSVQIAISEMDYLQPTLCLRMKKPSEKSDFNAISNAIFGFFEGLEY